MPHTKESYVQSQYGQLVGLSVVGVRHLSPAEMKWFGWEHNSVGIALTLSDGSELIPSSDPEGNNAGHLYHVPDLMSSPE